MADALRKVVDTATYYIRAMDYVKKHAPAVWEKAIKHASKTRPTGAPVNNNEEVCYYDDDEPEDDEPMFDCGQLKGPFYNGR